MSLATTIRPIEYLETHAGEALDHVTAARQPMVVTRDGRPVAVIQDVESYESARETIAMLRLVARGMGEIERGESSPLSEVRDRARGWNPAAA